MTQSGLVNGLDMEMVNQTNAIQNQAMPSLLLSWMASAVYIPKMSRWSTHSIIGQAINGKPGTKNTLPAPEEACRLKPAILL